MLSRLITRREQFIVVFLATAAIVGAVVLYVVNSRESAPADALVVDSRPEDGGEAAKDEAASEGSDSVSVTEAIRDEVTVSLVGAVIRPGVYTLDAGKRVVDLVRVAGGFLGSADSSNINLAAKLIDGTTLIVPREATTAGFADAASLEDTGSSEVPNLAAYTIRGGQASFSPGASSAVATLGGRIDLNRATQAELETLPGIGPILAGEIIRYRSNTRFTAVGDIMNVSGIGPKRYEAIIELVTVR